MATSCRGDANGSLSIRGTVPRVRVLGSLVGDVAGVVTFYGLSFAAVTVAVVVIACVIAAHRPGR
jgi:hypothetical protein